jgi:predicted O-methyltransferase YrrM
MTMTTEYLLGHDADELARLEGQARIHAPATRAILELAGIGPGMRVLDLGTGAGDVAFQVAELVGPEGSVVGVDQSAEALTFARHRAEQRGLTTVSFVEEDLHSAGLTGEFDAVVGRMVLLYVPDPAEVVRRVAGLLRPGGVVAMMEVEMTTAGLLPPTDLGERVRYWIVEAFRRSGLDPSLGARLDDVLARAGLRDVSMLGIQGYLRPGDRAGAALAAGTVRTLLPAIEKTGVATLDEIDIDTLEERVAQNCVDHNAIFKPPVLVGGWARVS